MRIDTNLLGTVRMPDAGADGPPATSRRYGRADYAQAYADFVEIATAADTLGFDTLWYTEHHFQHEGYEVVPNQIQLGLYSAALTRRLRFGQMFNIVPQWHPLRLAEDFAMADVLTRGRRRAVRLHVARPVAAGHPDLPPAARQEVGHREILA